MKTCVYAHQKRNCNKKIPTKPSVVNHTINPAKKTPCDILSAALNTSSTWLTSQCAI